MEKRIPSAEVLKKYLANEGSETEREIVNAWYYELDLKANDHFTEGDEEDLYERIRTQILETETVREPKVFPLHRFIKYASGIAAILFVGFGLMYLFPKNAFPKYPKMAQAGSDQIIFKNDQKRILRYQLPDSTIVWLNPCAEISYSKLFTKNKTRETHFEGEGFFDVKPDKKHPFVIFTGAMQTTVMGTSFNIRANKNDSVYEVSVVTGSVKVSGGEPGKTIVLKPKQQVVFQKENNTMALNTLPENKPDLENWETVSLLFNETPMTEVAAKLEHTFKIKIEFANPDIEKCRLKIDFNNQHLSEILEMIEMLLGTNYKMKGDRVIFGGEGCGSDK